MILAALAFFVQAQGVTLTAHAERLDKLMVELAKASGQNLKVAPQLAGEICAIAVHDAPLAEVMTKLAEVTDGRWDQEGKTTYLVRSESALAAHRARAFKSRIADLEEGYAGLWPSKVRSRWPQPSGGVQELEPDVYRLWKTFDDDDLAGIDRGQSLIFSTRPKIGELPMLQASLDALGGLLKHGDRPEVLSSAVKVTLTISSQDGQPWPSLMLEAFASQRDGESDRVCFSVLHFLHSRWQRQPDRPPAADPIRLSTLTQEFGAAHRLISDRVPTELRREDRALLQKVRARLCHPDEIDPLWYSSDLLIAISRRRGVQLVADLPDRFADETIDDIDSPRSLADEDASLDDDVTVETNRNTAWLTLRPLDPDLTAATRADRTMLAEVGSLGAGKSDLSWTGLAKLLSQGLVSVENFSLAPHFHIQDPATLWASFLPKPNRLMLSPAQVERIRFLMDIAANPAAHDRRMPVDSLPGQDQNFIIDRVNELNKYEPRFVPPTPSELAIAFVRKAEPALVAVRGKNYLNASLGDWMSDRMLPEPGTTAADLAQILNGDRDNENTIRVQLGSSETLAVTIFRGDTVLDEEAWPIFSVSTDRVPLPVALLPADLHAELEVERAKDDARWGRKKVTTNPPR